MRFRALRAAIVRIVLSRNMQLPEIDRFFDRARKKSLEGNPGVLGYDWRHGEQKMAMEVFLKQTHVTLMREEL